MMSQIRSMKACSMVSFLFLVLAVFLAACSPEVGSDAWCKKMKETDKAEWSGSDAAAFAKNCVFK